MTKLTFNDLVGTPQTVIANLILDHYAELGMSDAQLAIFLQIIKFSQQGEKFPSPAELAAVVKHPVSEVYQALQAMTQKSFIAVTTYVDHDQHIDQYDVAPFFERLSGLQEDQQNVAEFQEEQADVTKLYQEVEVEFGRTLSPIEMETVDGWLNRDHFSSEIIRLALREAVLNDARSFKYIDRILLDWQKRHIKNAADLQRYKSKFQ
ncbi:DnaD domain-containing protein [Lapidilactobacillus mulanensis]|uniref:DnaD domain-containing protein n=1 Tax=Lapidilactobacillus mulanensis TaxID=2485999 RepID=A0ABW4DSK6_9LACO|nr:DnaD domain protein [Lapidilactobacillus mulanensis]